MPLKARQWIRPMRGGSQAQLVLAEDGGHYVVKCRENPQHRRILVNEWIAAALLDYLGIARPQVEIIEFEEAFLEQYPDVGFVLGGRREPVKPGWHFGSRLPVDPARFVIYDYLPDALLRQVANRRDFLGALVFDKWVYNADSRQSIFFRAQVREWAPAAAGGRKVAFVALMMDHGFILGGPHWRLEDVPLAGLYCRPVVYEEVSGLASFEPWLELVRSVPAALLEQAFRRVPDVWLDGDGPELESVLERLWRRRSRVPDLIEGTRLVRANPFPNWK